MIPRARLVAALAAGLLVAQAALSRSVDDATAASALRTPAQGDEKRDRPRSAAESNSARERAYYRLARKDCMAFSDRTRKACLNEARMMWGR